MLTAQFEGFTVSSDSADEMTALIRSCSSLTSKITSEAKTRRQPNSVKAMVESAVKAAEAPQESAGDNSRTVFVKRANCGHTYEVNSPRGAKAALCPSCKRISGNGNSEAPTEAKPEPVKPQTSGKKSGGKRNSGKKNYEPTPLEDMPTDKHATQAAINRILDQLATKKVKPAQARSIEQAISTWISVRAASAIYRELKELPLA